MTSFCPYVGLRPYGEEHREYFFGRTGDIRVICSTVLAVPVSLLYGPSGVGKSSVLLAGVIPELRLRQGMAVVVFNEWQGTDALAKLKARCIEAASLAYGSRIDVDASLPLDELLARTCKVFGGTFVILLDQFEEYFLYHPESEVADGFDREFARSVNREEVDAGFLLSMREDGLSKLDRFKVRIPNLLSNTIRLSHLDEKSAAEAIVGPLGIFNERFRPDPPYSIEPNLVTVILQQVKSSSLAGDSRGQIETPLLQLVMERLWTAEAELESHALRLATYNDRLGDVKSLLQTHLTSVMTKLAPGAQTLCARFFDRLVTPSGSKLACRLDDLVKYANSSEKEVQAVAEKLDQERILRRINPPPGQTAPSYEIFHDVYAPAVLAWRQQYLAEQSEREARAQAAAEAEERARESFRQSEIESARTLASEQELRATAERKRAEAERQRADDEARSSKRFRVLSWSLAAMTLLAVGLAMVAYHQRNLAVENGELAVTQRNLAVENGKLAFARELAGQARSTQGADPELSVILALHATTVVTPTPPEVISALNEAVFAARIRYTVSARPGSKMIGVRYSPDGSYLATVSDDGIVDVWDAPSLSRQIPLQSFKDQMPNSAAVAFDKDSALVATASPKHEIVIRQVRTGEPVRVLTGHTAMVMRIAFSPTANLIASSSADGSARLWSLDTGGAEFPPMGHTKGQLVETLAFSPDGARLATGSSDQTVKVWNTRNPKDVKTLEGHKDSVKSVAFSADSKLLVTSGMDRAVIIWDATANSWSKRSVLRGHGNTVFEARFGARDRLIATASADGSAKIWDTASGQELFALNGHTGPIEALDFSPQGDRLATASWDGTVRIWDVSPVHLDAIIDLAFSPDNKFVATASRDKTVMIWDAASGEVVRTLRGHRDSLWTIHFSPDSRQLVSGDEGGLAIVWDMATGKPVHRFDRHDGVVSSVRFSPKGTFVATSSEDGKVRGWDASNGEKMPELAGDDYKLNALAFSPDEKLLAAASGSGQIIVWDLTAGKRLFTRKGERLLHDNSATQVVFSPDGRMLASCGDDYTARIWDAATGREKKKLAGHKAAVNDVVFSPDGTQLATASLDNTVILWDVATGNALHTLVGHRQAVARVRFSRNGLMVATASWDRTARLWDAKTGKELGSLSHAGPVEAAEFSSDGKRLATAGSDRALRLNFRDTGAEGLGKLARSRITRALTPDECAKYFHEASCPAPR